MVSTCQITLPGIISATVEPLTLQGTIAPSATAPRYPGPYEVMPAEDAQVLATSGLVMSSDVSVGGMGEAITEAVDGALATMVDGSYEGEYRNEEITFIRGQAFANCKNLTRIDLPNVVYYGASFCINCTGLESVNLPKLYYCEHNSPQSEFSGCTSLRELRLPSYIGSGWHAFWGMTALELLDFGALRALSTELYNSPKLATLILRYAGMTELLSVAILKDTSIANGTGYIYVPRALIEKYKVATNWATYADQFRAIEDYPDICDPDQGD